jgi:phosphatidylglycerophosphatase A
LPDAKSPDLKFLASHWTHFIALGFGSGLVRWAPGTAGSLLAWLLFDTFDRGTASVGWAPVLAIGFAVGTYACGRTGRNLGSPDHGAMVWDEMIAQWMVLVFLPRLFWWQAIGFGLFRVFDIAKPPPIAYFDRRFKGGFGVMFDDLLAGCYALFVIALGVRIKGAFA